MVNVIKASGEKEKFDKKKIPDMSLIFIRHSFSKENSQIR